MHLHVFPPIPSLGEGTMIQEDEAIFSQRERDEDVGGPESRMCLYRLNDVFLSDNISKVVILL